MSNTLTLLSEDFPPNVGGVAQWAKGVASGFHSMDWQVNVLCRYCDNFGPQHQFDYPVEFLKHSYWKRLRSWYWQRALSQQLRTGNIPKVVIASKWNTARGLTGLRRRYNFTLITVVHGTDVTKPMSGLKRRWLKSTLNNSDKIVSVSKFTADYLIEQLNIPTDKIVIIPNGVDPESFSQHTDHQALKQSMQLSEKKVILTLARVIERKGHDMAIRALKTVANKISNVRYLIAGPGDPDEIERLRTIANECGVSDKVIFVGYVPNEDLVRMYGLCDIYIMPSRFDVKTGDSEGFGITYLEANSCKKPVIGGASGGVVDAIVDGKTGYLVDPHNPDAIAEKIITLLNDQKACDQMGQNGYDRIVQEFNWTAISRKILASIA